MTVSEFWAAVKVLGLRNPVRGSPDLDYLCTTRDGQVAQVTDPERLTTDQRVAVIMLLRQRHCPLDS